MSVPDRMLEGRFAISLQDVHEAADRIRDFVIRTPVIHCPELNDTLQANVFFKCENMQHIGAFKTRGACNAVFSLDEDQAGAGVLTHSSGNHAAALARAAGLRGIKAYIVMPANSSPVKIAAVKRFGVQPVFCEPDAVSRQAAADKLIAETGASFIHPYNNSLVMAGQATAALEFLTQVADLDIVIAPVGGGGLLAGTLIAVKSTNPQVLVFGAEPQLADDARRSLISGQIELPKRYDTMADGLRTPLGDKTFPIIQHFVEDILLADEGQIKAATRRMLSCAKLVVEPSAAVPLACIERDTDRFRGKNVGVILSGGNLDVDSFFL